MESLISKKKVSNFLFNNAWSIHIQSITKI